jgi:peptidoglycan/xylan/chitin deacetylase (PgdA/CDA1 family)
VTPETPPDTRAVSPDELARLAASPLVTIGAHTLEHAHLSSQPMDEQLHTIAGSKRALEEMLQQPVSHFAYPFGGHDDFDDHSVAAVTKAGFDTACTTVPGSASASSDPFRLPRRIVLDWGRARFRAQLLRWRMR